MPPTVAHGLTRYQSKISRRPFDPPADERLPFRRFERLTLGPLARIVEVELRAKLDAPDLALNFDSLRASDFAGVARAYKALTEAGLSPDAAAGQLDMDL